MQLLEINKLSKEVAGETLFDVDHLTITNNSKIGVVGNNGTGKSTLLNYLFDVFENKSNFAYSVGYYRQLYENESCSGGEYSKQRLLSILESHPPLLILDEPNTNLDSINQQWLLRQLKKYQA